jgi:protein subunit release factor B
MEALQQTNDEDACLSLKRELSDLKETEKQSHHQRILALNQALSLWQQSFSFQGRYRREIIWGRTIRSKKNNNTFSILILFI